MKVYQFLANFAMKYLISFRCIAVLCNFICIVLAHSGRSYEGKVQCLKKFRAGVDCSVSIKPLHECCIPSNRRSYARKRAGRNFPPEMNFDFKQLRKEKESLEMLLQKNEVEENDDMPVWKTSDKSTTTSQNTMQMTAATAAPDIIFPGGQRRGIKIAEESENKSEKQMREDVDGHGSFFAHHDHKLVGPHGYDRGLCATLRVPCRFVNDHPCCKYEMPLDLVARARSLDGSADVKWRPKSLGGPRSSSGRSLNVLSPSLPSSMPNSKIKYNFAVNKRLVQIPTYHFDGGPEMTATIVGLCWRLHYLRCPSGQPESRPTQEKMHPCCQLLSKPSGIDPIESRVSKWLHHHHASSV